MFNVVVRVNDVITDYDKVTHEQFAKELVESIREGYEVIHANHESNNGVNITLRSGSLTVAYSECPKVIDGINRL